MHGGTTMHNEQEKKNNSKPAVRSVISIDITKERAEAFRSLRIDFKIYHGYTKDQKKAKLPGQSTIDTMEKNATIRVGTLKKILLVAIEKYNARPDMKMFECIRCFKTVDIDIDKWIIDREKEFPSAIPIVKVKVETAKKEPLVPKVEPVQEKVETPKVEKSREFDPFNYEEEFQTPPSPEEPMEYHPKEKGPNPVRGNITSLKGIDFDDMNIEQLEAFLYEKITKKVTDQIKIKLEQDSAELAKLQLEYRRKTINEKMSLLAKASLAGVVILFDKILGFSYPPEGHYDLKQCQEYLTQHDFVYLTEVEKKLNVTVKLMPMKGEGFHIYVIKK